MRIHTDTLTRADIRAALAGARDAGLVAQSVIFKMLSEHRSQSHARAFEIQLESLGKRDGDGRRFGNSGSYGRGDGWAATFDEWGHFLAALFIADPAAVCGTVKHPTYNTRDGFNERTGGAYDPEWLTQQWGLYMYGNPDTDGDPYPFVQGRASGRAGRVLAGRFDGEWMPTDAWQKLVDGSLDRWADVRYLPRERSEVEAAAAERRAAREAVSAR